MIAGGDSEVLGTLWDRHARPVYSLALRMLHDPGWAEEIAQDVFLRLWSKPHSFDPSRGDLRRWLLAITHNTAVNGLRGRRGTARDRDAGPEPLEFMARGEEGPEQSTIKNLRAESMRFALNELPSEQREVVELVYFEGLTQLETAQHTGQPLGTVKTRIRSGLRKLRAWLEAGEEDDVG